MMSALPATSRCRFVLVGEFGDTARWAAAHDLHLSEWAHHGAEPLPLGTPTLRVYALFDVENELDAEKNDE